MKKLIKMLIILNYSFLILGIHPFGANCFSQWIQQTVPVNKPIQGIEFVDTLHGWVCTDRGTPADTGYILYTSNGGANWLVQFKQYNFAFADIDMVNSLTGYTSGFLFGAAIPRMYKTTNGGVTWDSLSLNINHFIEDIFFVNENSGYTCNSFFGPDVRTTTDGGNTWIIRTSGITVETQRLFFLNYDTGFCGASGVLYKTYNAGVNWVVNGVFSESVYGIFFANQETGWISLSGHKIGKTTNGGINWIIQHPFDPRSENIYDIYFIGNIGWAATGWAGKILKSTDGGLNWGYQNVPIGSVNMSFTDTSNGWCGQFSMSHTTNGGGQ